MSDRPGSQQPDSKDDDDLDYLDAGLSDAAADETAPAEAIDEPPARTSRQALSTEPSEQPDSRPSRQAPPTETVEQPDTRPSPVAPQTTVVTPPPARDRSWTWPLINAIGLLVVIAVSFLANALEFNGQTTGDVINRNPVPFQPADWVFTIWGVIYAMLLVFVIYGLLPAGRRNVRLRRISPLFLIANVANVVWLVLWHWEQIFPSLITMLVLLGSLLGIYIGLRIKNPIRRSAPAEKTGWFKRLVMWAPFSVYLGWICVATLANLMVWLRRSGWDGGPFSYNVWAVVFMLVGALAAALFVFTAKDALIPLVFAVAYVGIADHSWGESALVSVAAIVFAVVCVGLAGISSLLAFDRGVDRGVFGRRKSPEIPPPEMHRGVFSRRKSADVPPPMTHVDDGPREH